MKITEAICPCCGESFIDTVNKKREREAIDIKKGNVRIARFKLCGSCFYIFNRRANMKKFEEKFMKAYERQYGSKSYRIASNDFKNDFIKKYFRKISRIGFFARIFAK